MRARLVRGAASSVGTRRESVRGGSVAASMPPHGPAPGYDTAPPLFVTADRQAMPSLFNQPPTTSEGACTRTGVGPYAAWMPRKSLHGRTCGVSHAGTRASARSRPKHSHKTGRPSVNANRKKKHTESRVINPLPSPEHTAANTQYLHAKKHRTIPRWPGGERVLASFAEKGLPRLLAQCHS
ncbi:hypothetical protein BJD10_02010 [Xanthomonas hortorum pv. gardneri]|nr:hypothetical protein BJD10_02010 [Xanthomonas hortorum pv. gardneri]PPU37414.1 hypothetical protein XcyCFBP4188_19300 [Xanthomonas hortorum pv. cynarae]